MNTSTTEEPSPTLHLPVQGTWKLIKSPGHDKFMFDLIAADEQTHQTSRRSRLRHIFGRVPVDAVYSWSQPIYAPGDGVVVQASDGSPDREQLSLLRDLAAMLLSRPKLDPGDIRPFAGNYVIIQHRDAYIFLAHLQCGSLQVTEGDPVEAGQRVGRVGNSGVTLEPHLHFQLLDRIDDLTAATAPPFLIKEYERWTGQGWESAGSSVLHKGELIRFGPRLSNGPER